MEFIDKISGYLDNPPASGFVLTKFLTSSEQAVLKNAFKNKASFTTYGGYDNAELKRACLFADKDFFITCFQIKYNEKFLRLTHQNILGTLMSLSITKDSIGDILPSEATFFVISELKDFLISEFKMINNVSIELIEIQNSNFSKEVVLKIDTFSVTSLRLDAVVSKITKTSRENASIMIANDLVKVNHEISNKTTKSIFEEDVISIRKFGRFIIKDTKNFSKKGKIVVQYGKYI